MPHTPTRTESSYVSSKQPSTATTASLIIPSITLSLFPTFSLYYIAIHLIIIIINIYASPYLTKMSHSLLHLKGSWLISNLMQIRG
ncbi:hypothetical protein RJT34_15681 [Clitoria ternatea]|uniref:Uncharacterized protein n=1 Tax=Clitoria ternatea TaxID=43366 RepID=A0AAN9J5W1_CLITE